MKRSGRQHLQGRRIVEHLLSPMMQVACENSTSRTIIIFVTITGTLQTFADSAEVYDAEYKTITIEAAIPFVLITLNVICSIQIRV